MVQLFSTLIVGAALLGTVAYAQITAECGIGLGNCPSDKPCCSQYGVCGVGAYCLGGCDPKHSFSIGSCTPAPVCRNIDSTFPNLDRIADKTKYLGNSAKADWVADGEPTIYDNNLLLTMAPNTVGTVLASSVYVWYGKISATLKTSRGKGVVSAFILLSDMKDEIDYEWVGVELNTAQTNFYWQGVPDYNNGGNITLAQDTYNNYHTYEIDWTPDTVTWSVDGQVGRVLKKSDTWNSTCNCYNYPQTPARVQLSLWPGGLSTNAPGTIAWAGGEIDWNSQDIKDNGYYYVTFKEVKIQCYDPPSDAKKEGSGSVSYIYNDAAGLESNVVMTDEGTILKSFLGTGTNMTADVPKSSSTGTASGSAASATDLATIPGLTGAGTGANGLRGDDDSSSSSSTTASGSAATGSSTSASDSASTSGGFVQGNVQGTSEAATQGILRGSMLAIIVAVVGVMVL